MLVLGCTQAPGKYGFYVDCSVILSSCRVLRAPKRLNEQDSTMSSDRLKHSSSSFHLAMENSIYLMERTVRLYALAYFIRWIPLELLVKQADTLEA